METSEKSQNCQRTHTKRDNGPEYSINFIQNLHSFRISTVADFSLTRKFFAKKEIDSHHFSS